MSPNTPEQEVELYLQIPDNVNVPELTPRVRVLGQLVQAEGPVGPSRVQLGLHRLWEDEAENSRFRVAFISSTSSFSIFSFCASCWLLCGRTNRRTSTNHRALH
ncbi:hypothetical protein EYF80_040076 [Liparis tanakae]|uniref:Uncharacterized protein n=1 Tax=Liparis tanakae TaxID=230148 RepID=A0A4Z2G836_9TELE|nr:hypothetical protein EYF80_040076 [Liparis tanakae]